MMRHLAVLLTLLQCVNLSSATALAGWNKVMVPRGGTSGAEAVLPEQHMPSLFASEESEYDQYAAALAATEALRRIRDKAMTAGKQKHGSEATEDQKRIRAEYLVNSGKVLKAMGMSVSQFNQLSREVNQDEELKEKVNRNQILRNLNCMCIRSKLTHNRYVGIFR